MEAAGRGVGQADRDQRGDGIMLAVVASIIDHLRHTYHPRNSVLVKSPSGHWHPIPVRPGAPPA